MSRKNKYIEELTQEQKSSLKKGYQRGKSHIFRRKCQCILLSHEGKRVKCDICSSTFITNKSLKRHVTDVHVNPSCFIKKYIRLKHIRIVDVKMKPHTITDKPVKLQVQIKYGTPNEQQYK